MFTYTQHCTPHVSSPLPLPSLSAGVEHFPREIPPQTFCQGSGKILLAVFFFVFFFCCFFTVFICLYVSFLATTSWWIEIYIKSGMWNADVLACMQWLQCHRILCVWSAVYMWHCSVSLFSQYYHRAVSCYFILILTAALLPSVCACKLCYASWDHLLPIMICFVFVCTYAVCSEAINVIIHSFIQLVCLCSCYGFFSIWTAELSEITRWWWSWSVRNMDAEWG